MNIRFIGTNGIGAITGIALVTAFAIEPVQSASPWAWSLEQGQADQEYREVFGEKGVESPLNRPGPRTTAAACTGTDGAHYLFGGFAGFGVRNDFWRLGTSGDWTWLSGEQYTGEPGVYGTQGIAHADNTPGGRDGAAMWGGTDGKIYLFGGSDYDGGARDLYNDLWSFDPGTEEWTWLTGSDTGNALATYGARFAASTTYTPGAKWNASTWVGDDGMLYLFGGVGMFDTSSDIERNDLWRYNTATGEWAWLGGGTGFESYGDMGTIGVPDANNIPGGRWSAATGKGADGKLYLFGGRGYVTNGLSGINDLWSYDTTTHIWTWLHGFDEPDEPGVYGTQGIPAAANTPGTRYDAVSWTGTDGSLYVFGGIGNDAAGSNGDLNDLWHYNPSTNEWTWLDGSDTRNTAGTVGPAGTRGAYISGGRSDGVSWSNPDGSKLLWGGRGIRKSGSTGELNDLWVLHDAGDWAYLRGGNDDVFHGSYGTQGVAADTNNPGGRYEHAATELNDEIWIFGGHGEPESGAEGVLGDLWFYDPALKQWTWQSGAKTTNAAGNNGTIEVADPANVPGARHGASLWSGDDGKLYLFGGSGPGSYGSQASNEMWSFDPGTGIWTWLKGSSAKNVTGTYGTEDVSAPANTPGSRYNAASWKGDDGKLYLYGGRGYGSSASVGDLSDLWLYDPTTNEWTWIDGNQTTGVSPTYQLAGFESAIAFPGGRSKAAAAKGSDGQLYIFGGAYNSAGSGEYADLFRYNPVSGNWTFLGGEKNDVNTGVYGTLGTADPANYPGGRMGSTMWLDANGNAYVWGGYGYAATNADPFLEFGFLGDLWAFNTSSLEWKWIAGPNEAEANGSLVDPGSSANNLPPGRQSAAVVTMSDGSPYLIGGYGVGLGSNDWDFYSEVWSGYLSATGIDVSPDSFLSFGNRDIADGPTAPLSVTIRNDGTVSANITADITDNGGGSFEITSAPDATVAAGGGETTVGIRFVPQQFGVATGALRIQVDDPEVADIIVTLAGNVTESAPPTITVQTSSPTVIGGPIAGNYIAADTGGSDLATVGIAVRKEGGTWQTFSSSLFSSLWVYTPTDGAGTYYFQGIATDNAGNSTPVPTGTTGTGEIAVVYNTAPNAPITFPVPPGGPYVYTCPMFDSPEINVVITLTGVTTGGTITVSRTTGDHAPAGFDASQLIDEFLTIAPGGGLSFANANVVAQYDPGLGSFGVGPADVTTAFRDFNGTVTQFPVTLNTGDRTMTFDTPGFSNWYFGNATLLSAKTWMIYE